MEEGFETKSAKPKLKVRGEDDRARGDKRPKKNRQESWWAPASFDWWGRLLLLLVVVLAPWWFASVSALPQFVICCVFLVCFLIWILQFFRSAESSRPHSISLLVLLFLILGFVQQIQLSSSLPLATKQNEIRNRLADQLTSHPELGESLRSQTQVALNSSAASYQYYYFCMVTAAFFLGTRFFFRRHHILFLATGVAINGSIIAIYGAFQKVIDPGQIYGHQLSFGGNPFGPFVNRNNAAGYLLMTLGCGLAILVYSYLSSGSGRSKSRSGLSKEGLWHSIFEDLRSIVGGLNVPRICMLAICGCTVAGIAISLSRGGMLSLILSFVAFTIILVRLRSRRAVVLMVLLFVPTAVVTILFSGMQGDVAERLETLRKDELWSTELRTKLWYDSLQATTDYPVLGAGVGNFPYVYKEYQTFPDTTWCFHAENIFVEVLVTCGYVGGGLLILGLIAILGLAVYYPASRAETDRMSSKSITIGSLMVFILVAQCGSNFFDFGLLVPSNGILFALMMGALAGAWGIKVEVEQRSVPRRLSRMPSWSMLPMALLFGILTIKCGVEFWRTSATENANRAARTKDVEKLTRDEIDRAIARLENVLSGRPNLQTHEYLARLYVLRLQHEYVDYQLDNMPPNLSVTREEVWKKSNLRLINFQLAEMSDENRKAAVARLMNLEFFKSNVDAATEQYAQALSACPLSVRSIIGLAELAYLNEVKADGYLEALAKYNIKRTDHLVRIGDVALAHDQKKSAVNYWRLATEISESVSEFVIPTAIYFLDEVQIVEELIPSNPKLIDKIADAYFSKPSQAEIREQLYRRIKQILSDDVYADADSNYLLAKAHMETGDINNAIERYETATLLAPLNTRWKVELSRLYFDTGRTEDAVAEIKKCLAIEPGKKSLNDLLDRYKSY